MDELNIRVNENNYLLSIIENGGIVCLKLMLDEIFLMSEAFFKALNTSIKKKPRRDPPRQLEIT